MTRMVEMMDAGAASGATAAPMFIQPGDHFQRTADDDAGFHIAENEADQVQATSGRWN